MKSAAFLVLCCLVCFSSQCTQTIDTLCFLVNSGSILVTSPPFDRLFPPYGTKNLLRDAGKYYRVYFGANCYPIWADSDDLGVLYNLTEMHWGASECRAADCMFAPNTSKTIQFYGRDKCKEIKPGKKEQNKHKGRNAAIGIAVSLMGLGVISAGAILTYRFYKKRRANHQTD